MTNEMPKPTRWDYAVLVPTVYGTIGLCFAEGGEAINVCRHFCLTTSPEKDAVVAERQNFYRIVGEESPPLEYIVTNEVVEVGKEKADTQIRITLNVKGPDIQKYPYLDITTTLSKLVEDLYSETKETKIKYEPERVQDNKECITMATLVTFSIKQLNILPLDYWGNVKRS